MYATNTKTISGSCATKYVVKSHSIGSWVSILTFTGTMSKNKDFVNLLELPYGEFELDGCAIGYPDQIPLEKKSFSVNEVIKWL